MAEATVQICLRGDTAANWAAQNPVLAKNEVGLEDGKPPRRKVGDGVTPWKELPYDEVTEDTPDFYNPAPEVQTVFGGAGPFTPKQAWDALGRYQGAPSVNLSTKRYNDTDASLTYVGNWLPAVQNGGFLATFLERQCTYADHVAAEQVFTFRVTLQFQGAQGEYFRLYGSADYDSPYRVLDNGQEVYRYNGQPGQMGPVSSGEILYTLWQTDYVPSAGSHTFTVEKLPTPANAVYPEAGNGTNKRLFFDGYQVATAVASGIGFAYGDTAEIDLFQDAADVLKAQLTPQLRSYLNNLVSATVANVLATLEAGDNIAIATNSATGKIRISAAGGSTPTPTEGFEIIGVEVGASDSFTITNVLVG